MRFSIGSLVLSFPEVDYGYVVFPGLPYYVLCRAVGSVVIAKQVGAASGLANLHCVAVIILGIGQYVRIECQAEVIIAGNRLFIGRVDQQADIFQLWIVLPEHQYAVGRLEVEPAL